MLRLSRALGALVVTALVSGGLTYGSALVLQAAAAPAAGAVPANGLPPLPTVPLPTLTLPTVPLPTVPLPTSTVPTTSPTSSPTASETATASPGAGLLELVSGLTLPGTALVGEPVTLTDPVWSLPGVTTTYQWLRDGVPIPGAVGQTYVPAVEDAGHSLAVEATAALLGIPVLTKLSDALGVPLASEPQLVPAGDVTVLGSRKVGTPLTLSGPTWDQDGVTNTYQWLRDGGPIAGATAATYPLVAADLGHSISVRVTGQKDRFTANTITSDPVQPVVGDALQFTMKPGITGTAKAGRLLTADPGQWTGGTEGSGPPAYSFQWLRDGAAIPGAVAQTYQVEHTDAGRALSVLVTATRPAYRSGKFTTASLTVAKLRPRLTASLSKKTVRRGETAVLTLVLRVPGLAAPTGAVQVLDGRKSVEKATFTVGKQGRLTIRLGRLKPGVHRLKAVYAGSPAVAGTTSKVVRLTVQKAKPKK